MTALAAARAELDAAQLRLIRATSLRDAYAAHDAVQQAEDDLRDALTAHKWQRVPK